MPKTRVGSRLVFWLPVLCLALAPAIGTVDDAAAPALEAPAAAPSEVAALLPANTPPTLKALGGASGQTSRALAVPLRGKLLLIWGGQGSFAASSEDSSVASVAVYGAEIVVAGVAAGNTEIVVRVGSGQIRVPVQVGG